MNPFSLSLLPPEDGPHNYGTMGGTVFGGGVEKHETEVQKQEVPGLGAGYTYCCGFVLG